MIALFLLVQFIACYYYSTKKGMEKGKVDEVIVRVRLIFAREGIGLKAKKGLIILTEGKKRGVDSDKEVKLYWGKKGLTVKINEQTLLETNDTVYLQSEGLIQVGERFYRGEVRAFVSPESGLIVINRLRVREYLYGVIPCEIGPINERTFEAVKAQVIVARSFALSRLGRRKGLGYDLYDSYLRDQEYRGAGYESELSNRAVEETAGEVLTWEGEVAEALYHCCCGGRTAQGSRSYLIPVFDTPGHKSGTNPFCAQSPHFSWKVTIPRDSVEKVLARLKRLKEQPRVRTFKLIRDEKSKRVKSLWFKTDKGELKVSGEDFRFALGLKSQMFDMKITKSKVLFTGKGWGHGIGLCQDGAVAMARRGYNYHQILNHYYPLLKIRRLN